MQMSDVLQNNPDDDLTVQIVSKGAEDTLQYKHLRWGFRGQIRNIGSEAQHSGSISYIGVTS